MQIDSRTLLQKAKHPTGVLCFFSGKGIEPIYMELSGGQFLPPVLTLVATLIFAIGENANRFPYPRYRLSEQKSAKPILPRSGLDLEEPSREAGPYNASLFIT